VLEPGSELGGYRIERQLGRGGMGVVYEATQIALARKVALKVLPPELGEDTDFRERFRREGMAQASVDHPHIITVYEAGDADGRLFIAMRLVDGPTLKDLIRSGELTRARALALLGQVAGALDAAHRSGLVHRDVKPPNILIGPGDHGYLADFGITKALAETGMTQTGQFLGTPHYIAPEQVDGRSPVTAAADIYALAAVCYECLTGKVPFERDTNQAVLFAHVYDDAARASEVDPSLPGAIDQVLARGMAKDPAERQATASELVGDLVKALGAGPTVVAAPPAPPPPPAGSAPPTVGSPGDRDRPRRKVLPLVGGGALAVVAAVAGVALLAGGGGGDKRGDAPKTAATSATGKVTVPPESERVTDKSGEVTLGSLLDIPDHTPAFCFGEPDPSAPCTVAQTALADATTAAPGDGKIVRWRVSGAAGPMALVLLRGRVAKDGSATMARVARAEEQDVPDTGLHSFTTSLPARKGDVIGLQLGRGAHLAGPYVGEGLHLVRWGPVLGTTPKAADPPQDGYELLYNADFDEGG
jgi:hypothetical protein